MYVFGSAVTKIDSGRIEFDKIDSVVTMYVFRLQSHNYSSPNP
jgi:hypothetical protein